MSHAGVNLAITTDGGTYNKLRRPDDFVAACASTSTFVESSVPTPTDSNKRKLEEAEISDGESDDEPDNKRLREGHVSKATSVAEKPFAVDTRRIARPIRDNGMHSMFPGLDGDDSSDETTKDALAYLRSVRSEASAIPTLLVAEPDMDEDETNRTTYNGGRGDYRTLYRDGTWVAVDPYAAERSNGHTSDDADDLDPQAEYYSALLRRYVTLRSTLANADPKDLAALLEANSSKRTDSRPPTNRNWWLRTLEDDFPTPVRVAQIDDYNLFNAIEYCAESLDRYEIISKQKSCWIWTLLALAGERGTLDYSRVGRIRDLGHKAGQLSVHLRNDAKQSASHKNQSEEGARWEWDSEGVDSDSDELNGSDKNGASEDHNAQDITSTVPEASSHKEDEVSGGSNGLEAGRPSFEHSRLTRVCAQEDGAWDMKTEPSLGEVEEQVHNGDSADGSMSEGECEAEDGGHSKNDSEAINLEAAKARLLAQLGDRLVQPSVPANHDAPRWGGRHRHNGKVCQDSGCRINMRRREQYQNAGVPAIPFKDKARAKFSTSADSVISTRVEAEKQRQKLREIELEKATKQKAIARKGAPAASEKGTGDKEGSAQEQVNHSGDAGHDSQQSEQSRAASYRIPAGKSDDSGSEMRNTALVDLNTRVTIDMILTVVAECYGQKDLLRFREEW